jgi:putative tryptophan/tyrosine transport system substrate-binding protein
VLVSPRFSWAQHPAGRVYRVGFLSILSREQHLYAIKAFEEGLRSLSYRMGENVVIEYRFANGEIERLPALAADLVRLDVDIIVTGYNPITVAAMKATTTIPIVMTVGLDPVLSPVWRAPAVTSPGSPWMRAAQFWASGLSC